MTNLNALVVYRMNEAEIRISHPMMKIKCYNNEDHLCPLNQEKLLHVSILVNKYQCLSCHYVVTFQVLIQKRIQIQILIL